MGNYTNATLILSGFDVFERLKTRMFIIFILYLLVTSGAWVSYSDTYDRQRETLMNEHD
jgi:hypothetical protein